MKIGAKITTAVKLRAFFFFLRASGVQTRGHIIVNLSAFLPISSKVYLSAEATRGKEEMWTITIFPLHASHSHDGALRKSKVKNSPVTLKLVFKIRDKAAMCGNKLLKFADG